MKLSILSDVHLEMRTQKTINALVRDLCATVAAAEPTVLAVLGDVSPNPNTRLRFFADARPHFNQVVFVPGNHDYWNDWKGMEHTDTVRWPELEVEAGIHVLQKKMITLNTTTGDLDPNGSLVLAGATLWSNPDGACRSLIMDYEKIRTTAYRGYSAASPYITVSDVLALHLDHRAWFRETLSGLKATAGKTIIGLSHHCPSYTCRVRPPDPDGTDSAYFSDSDDLVGLTDVWAYGHTHIACHDGPIVSNPLGYPGQETGGLVGWGVSVGV